MAGRVRELCGAGWDKRPHLARGISSCSSTLTTSSHWKATVYPKGVLLKAWKTNKQYKFCDRQGLNAPVRIDLFHILSFWFHLGSSAPQAGRERNSNKEKYVFTKQTRFRGVFSRRPCCPSWKLPQRCAELARYMPFLTTTWSTDGQVELSGAALT